MPRRAHQPHVGAGAAPLSLLLLLVVSPLLLASAAPLDVVPLPYAADKYKAIDAETMTLHHDKHYAGYVSKYNAAIAAIANTTTNATAVTPSTPLPVALSLVNSPSLSSTSDLNTAIRNQGGGAWNHALFWKILAPFGANETRYATAASSALKRAVDADFAGIDGLRAALAKAAGGVFGSGWAFLCATAPLYGAPGVAGVAKAGGAAALAKPAVAAAIPAPRLAVVTAPNQDSPLTGLATTQTERCIPIAGIDVWEHAYYLKYRNLRPAYIDAVLGASATANTTGSDGLINWAVVSANYDKIAKATEAGGDGALLAAAGEIGQA